MSKKQKVDTLPKFKSNYYPKEITDKSIAKTYLKDENKPINKLISSLKKPVTKVEGKGIVHWFNNDLRLNNNKGLFEASKVSQQSDIPLIGLYVHCIEELYSHSISPFQLKFKLDSLEVLKKDLESLKIPLVVLKVEKAKDYNQTILRFLKDEDLKYLSTNMIYEVDELRHCIGVNNEYEGHFQAFHDNCVVPPGELKSGKGTMYSVFKPWYNSWCKVVNSKSIDNFSKPAANKTMPKYQSDELNIPEDKSLSSDQLNTYKELYTPGEHAAYDELIQYLKSDKIKRYDENRNIISLNVSSHLSASLAIGTLSSRTILVELLKAKLLSQMDKGDQGSVQWARQVAWRDFYKHIVANWPFLVMFRPFHLEYSDIQWEYNKEHWDAWCEGRTGFPIVDACMRELNATGYLNNRGRMIVASFLSKHLMIDWRYGEQYFSNHLVDTDFASNNGGWGFSSSTGVDPQPYFRIFNPYLQSERFDKKGVFIRQWVPELEHLDNKSIHKPEKVEGYPEPIVEHKFARERALQRYREH